MTCQPNWVCTGSGDICPGCRAKAAVANSGTISSFLKKPRSPPCCAPLGSLLYCFASALKSRAALELRDDLLRLGLIVHQDVLGVHLFLAGLAGDVLVIARVHRLLGNRRTDFLVQHRSLQRTVLGRRNLTLHGRVLVQARLPRLGDQQPAIDHLIQQHRVECLGGHAAEIGGQPLRRVLEVAEMDCLPVDLGHDRVGWRRRRSRRRSLGPSGHASRAKSRRADKMRYRGHAT